MSSAKGDFLPFRGLLLFDIGFLGRRLWRARAISTTNDDGAPDAMGTPWWMGSVRKFVVATSSAKLGFSREDRRALAENDDVPDSERGMLPPKLSTSMR